VARPRARVSNGAMRTLPAALVIAALASCQSSAPPEPEGTPYERAVAHAGAGRAEAAAEALAEHLRADPEAPQRALHDPALVPVRDDAGFRRVVTRALLDHGVTEVTIAPEDEPGDWVEVTFETVDGDGAPLAGVEFLVFATDAEGVYHPEIEGERTPRLFGSFVTGDDGLGVVRTVRPGPYPGTRNPRHLHVGARKGDMRMTTPGYVVFDDDPLLFEDGNEEPRGEAPRIRMEPVGDDGVARGRVTLTLR